tara:strand:- start:195 stop:380 length:186 start_codon:yes stop_codon:yes gene_type:complete
MGVFQSKEEQPNNISYGNIQEEGSFTLSTTTTTIVVVGSGVSIKSKAEAKNVHTVHFTQHI